jgi:hypothetical protein
MEDVTRRSPNCWLASPWASYPIITPAFFNVHLARPYAQQQMPDSLILHAVYVMLEGICRRPQSCRDLSMDT